MRYYPAFLDLKGKAVLVVGGGPVALQKAKALARCQAQVTVVAPITSKITRFPHSVRWKQRSFEPSDLKQVFLVCVATGDQTLNRQISRLCRKKKIWVNVADQPKLCDFIVPAVAARGPLVAALSTGGASPAMAKFLRKKVEEILRPEYADITRWLKRKRRDLKQIPFAARSRFLKEALEKIDQKIKKYAR